MPDHFESTIAAIATPPGLGGIGIIRISGPDSKDILSQIFLARSPTNTVPSHKLLYGWIVNSETSTPIDEVLIVFMQAPKTYTREDVVEIHCHGSYIVLQEILSLVFKAGARPADQGEFTKRAFLNGRIDLTQAEAVIEILNAKTKAGLDMAVNQLKGGLLGDVDSIRNSLVSLKAKLEVAIDFPEESNEILETTNQDESIHHLTIPLLQQLIDNSARGQIYRDGISVVIIGKPNVGKSSLLNALLKKDRAIVTEIPGTTRDTIEEYLNIHGMPVKVIDTAGIRDTAGAVEKIGIQRSKDRMSEADIVLLVLDSSCSLDHEDLSLYSSTSHKHIIQIANKSDLRDNADFDFPNQKAPGIILSAKTGAGIDNLENAIFEMATGNNSGWDPGCSSIPNIRHKASLAKCLQACHRITEGLTNNLPADLIAIELQSALDHLGDIIGFTTPDDVLDKIFAEFCIGK